MWKGRGERRGTSGRTPQTEGAMLQTAKAHFDQDIQRAQQLLAHAQGQPSPLSEDILRAAWTMAVGAPVGIGDALDGSDERGIRGIREIVDQLVEEAEGRMRPAGMDPISRFYVVNLLGQSEAPYDRFHRRLRHNPHIAIEDLTKRQLVKSAKGKVATSWSAEVRHCHGDDVGFEGVRVDLRQFGGRKRRGPGPGVEQHLHDALIPGRQALRGPDGRVPLTPGEPTQCRHLCLWQFRPSKPNGDIRGYEQRTLADAGEVTLGQAGCRVSSVQPPRVLQALRSQAALDASHR